MNILHDACGGRGCDACGGTGRVKHNPPAGLSHCWHASAPPLAVVHGPPRYPERCCWCGKDRVRTVCVLPATGHGSACGKLQEIVPVVPSEHETCMRRFEVT